MKQRTISNESSLKKCYVSILIGMPVSLIRTIYNVTKGGSAISKDCTLTVSQAVGKMMEISRMWITKSFVRNSMFTRSSALIEKRKSVSKSIGIAQKNS